MKRKLININKTFLLKSLNKKQTRAYGNGNPDSDLVQAQKSGKVNWIPSLPP
jgi:hypothetical protein